MSDYLRIHLHGDALIADINVAAPGASELHLWWLGQHSFIVKVASHVIYIDAFLTPMEGRQCPPLLTPSQCTNATIICGTHDHADHIDRPAWPGMAKAAPGAKFVVPRCLLDRGLGGGLGIAAGRFVGLDEGQSVEFTSDRALTPLPLREGQGEGRTHDAPKGAMCAMNDDSKSDARPSPNPSLIWRGIGSDPQPAIRITAIAAAHEFLDRDPVTGRYPYLGFIFECNGVTFYHSGDTVWYEGLQTKLAKWKFDLMMVPINGRDATRLRENIIGNMTYQEAADLCGPLGPKLVIPTHYDMFAGNPGDPEAFIDYMNVKYPGVKTHRCRYGERLVVGRQNPGTAVPGL